MKKRLFVFLICTIFILNSIFVEAQPTEVSTVDSLPGYPVQFTEEANYVELNNTMFVLRFFKDTAGYNEILSKNGTFLVYEDNINLQYLHQSGQWRNRGEPINISWAQINNYWWNVSRFYDDYEGTTYTVTYMVRADAAVKTSIEINSGQTDEYRVYWYPSGIVLTDWTNETWSLKFGREEDLNNWIGFDWYDVYQSFGNITETGVESHAQGRKANIWFYIGEIEENEIVILDPSTVGTSTAGSPLSYPYGRGNFHHNGYHWVSYTDGTNFIIKADADGDYSSGAVSTTVRSGNWAESQFDLVFDGTYLHYAFAQWDLYYRRGTPENDGSITWSAAEQTALNEANVAYDYPSIAVDTSGYVYIGYRRKNTTDNTYRPYVVKNDNNDGTWSTASGFPYELSSTETDKWRIISLSLTTARMYFIYGYGGHNNFGKLYTGSWGSQEDVDDGENLYKEYGHSGIAIDDDVYWCFTVFSAYDIMMTKRTYGVGWGTAETIEDETEYVYGTLSYDTATDDLYCFWSDPTDEKVYYKEKTGGAWGSTTELADEGDIWSIEKCTLSASSFNSVIGMTWINKSSSPRDVRYGFITLGQLFQRGVTLALTTSWVATRVLTLTRNVSLSLTSSWVPSRVQTLGRGVTLALVSSWTPSRVLTLARGVTLALSTTWSGDRVLTLARGATLALSSSWSADRVLRFPRDATLTLTTSWAGTRQVNYFANIILTLTTSWVATWPVPAVGLDFTLFVILFVIPLGVGLVSRKVLAVVSMLCGFFLVIYGAWLGANPYLATSQLFDETGQEWLTNVETIPMTPWPQVMIALCGIMLIAGSMGAMLRD